MSLTRTKHQTQPQSIPFEGVFNLVEQVPISYTFDRECALMPRPVFLPFFFSQVTPTGQKVLCFQPFESQPGLANGPSPGTALTKKPQFEHPIYLPGSSDASALRGAIDGRSFRFEGEIVLLGPAPPNGTLASIHFGTTTTAQSVLAGQKPAWARKQLQSKLLPPGDLSLGNDANAIASTSSVPISSPTRPRRRPKPSRAPSVFPPITRELIGLERSGKSKGKAAVRGQGTCTCKV
ncbi:hypothetical protein CROQUDRAFT_664907 [Cronartium quercuum f. sp. fusiforme G11]|uniref:Uncharacterized protein n=1 Tax=Cronartium quercuum f. sp. fusiforme G11 TaxID=708437 RepID=A0A9P6N6M5_9BASI|nr:hypothetical protein CROQUDRAFT_664907 [Cronartium quercuum f. sp. fusiforme G11]